MLIVILHFLYPVCSKDRLLTVSTFQKYLICLRDTDSMIQLTTGWPYTGWPYTGLLHWLALYWLTPLAGPILAGPILAGPILAVYTALLVDYI